MKMMRSKLISALALTVLGTIVIAGCNQDLGLEGKTFSCNEQSDCADGFVCDMDQQICVSEGSIGTRDATDDTTDTQDTQDPTDAADTRDTAEPSDTGDDADSSSQCECDAEQVCTEEGQCVECIDGPDCGEGRICQNNTCIDGSCTEPTECPDGYACDLEGERCFRTDVWCRQNSDCEPDSECDPSGRCVPSTSQRCDSLGDCADGQFCSVDGICEPISGAECTNHGACPEYEEICTDSIQTPGRCSLWRCEYSDLVADCPPLSYCSRESADNSGNPYNICLVQTCNPRISTSSCASNENCVPVAGDRGRCEKIGAGLQGEPCGTISGVGVVDCSSGLTCVSPPGSAARTCQKYCDPWNPSGECGNSEQCAPVPGEKVKGVCLRPGSVDCTDRATPVLAPCDDRSICLNDRGTLACSAVCRVGQGDCTGTEEVCNPSRVPGPVGFGRCDRRCQVDSDCDGTDRCRTVAFGTTSFKACARPCADDAGCTVPGQVCKDGFCD